MSTAGSICGACRILLALAAIPAQAGFVKYWTLEELAKADVLAVARVESVTMSAAPARQINDRVAVHTCTAGLAVLRSFGAVPERVRLRFDCYPQQTQLMSGYPVFPRPQRGDVRVFPLQRDGARWKLFANEGVGLVLPALPDTANMAGTALGFLVDELANSFLHGTYRQMFEAAPYVGRQRLVEERIATDLAPGDPRWLDTATAMLATSGYPRQPIEEAGGLIGRALGHVPASRRRPGIVRNMLRHSDVHGWGSATTLVPEFKDDPLLLELLPGYLAKLHPGAVHIAWSLAQHGQLALMAPALGAAVRLLAIPKGPELNDIYAATGLIVKHGTDAQFGKLLDAFRAAKDRDTTRYMQLWQVAYGEEGPRILQMIAVMIEDERPLYAATTMRYCDIAGGTVQRIAKADLGFKQWDQDLGERRAAVQRAREWLRDSIRR
jgi:hypothetical protein